MGITVLNVFASFYCPNIYNNPKANEKQDRTRNKKRRKRYRPKVIRNAQYETH